MTFPEILPEPRADQSERSARSRAVKDLVRKHFDLADTEPVFVAEVACGEDGCPDTETVIAVFLGDGRKEFRIARALHDVTGADIAQGAARLAKQAST